MLYTACFDVKNSTVWPYRVYFCIFVKILRLGVAGSIPASVSGFFIDIKSFRSHYGPEVDSASNRNEYQEYFLRVKVAGA